jgi:hypothetical protein
MSASTEKDNKLNIKEHTERKTERERERERAAVRRLFFFLRGRTF